ncbi:MAG: Wzz/FepE/Etk N-terminal domain-containing protein [Roseburia sp.]|nr:Wzz/FepE/Etk N-terminal domain-containing protein [Roseburia sp.]MCM1202053.1 Wzz/FepE/Etk N-terminal domain-containing protein [Bacteroides fragilis]
MEERRDAEAIEIDLLDLLGVLLGQIWLILGVGLMAALIAYALSRFVVAPTYESTTKIYILNKDENTSVTYSDVQLGSQLTKDYAELINSRYVLEEVIQSLGLGMTYKGLQGKVSVSTPDGTRVIYITVKDNDPVLAMNIANSVREAASRHIENVMDIDAVNVVETANMPTGKSAPNCTRRAFLGGVLGCFLVCAVILARALLDDTIKSSEDVEKYLGLTTLALIPVQEDGTEKLKRKKKKNSRERAERRGSSR